MVLRHFKGGGAGVHFSWFNCTDPTHGRKCVLADDPEADHTAQPAQVVSGAAGADGTAIDCTAVDVVRPK